MNSSIISKAVLFIILCTSLAIWSIVGFIFWLPLLFRTTTIFSAMIVHSTLTNQKPEILHHYLASASSFYSSGFRITYDVLYNPSKEIVKRVEYRIVRVIIEVIWTLLFWFITLSFFSPDIVNDIITIITTPNYSNWVNGLSQWYAGVSIGTELTIAIILAFISFLYGVYVGLPSDNKNKKK